MEWAAQTVWGRGRVARLAAHGSRFESRLYGYGRAPARKTHLDPRELVGPGELVGPTFLLSDGERCEARQTKDAQPSSARETRKLLTSRVAAASQCMEDTVLIRDVVYAVALHGSRGVLFSALWPLCPRVRTVDALEFIVHEMHEHPQLQLNLPDPNPTIPEAGLARVTGSDAIRYWMHGFRVMERTGHGTPSREVISVMDDALQALAKGLLQNQFTKRLGASHAEFAAIVTFLRKS